MESPQTRGQILATGQFIRFLSSMFSGLIQTLLLNSKKTNANNCPISFNECWSFGLSINGYYGLIFVLIFLLSIPIFKLKELKTQIKIESIKHYLHDLWSVLQNLTTLYLIIFVIGIGSLTNFTNIANIYLQYYLIELTNFEAGIDTITTYLATAIGVWLFKTYLIHRNWRYTQYLSTMFSALLSLAWISAYYNKGGTMNAWYTIFIDLDQQFAQGLAQVLYSMAVIELAKPGLESTTYELIITVGNAALLVQSIIATQLLVPLKATGCDDDGHCPSNTVNTSSLQAFNNSNGPEKYTLYTIILVIISIIATLIFTQFLPNSRNECQEWKVLGNQRGNSEIRGKITLTLAFITISVRSL